MFTDDYVARLEATARAHRIDLPPSDDENRNLYAEHVRGLLNAQVFLSPSAQPWMLPRWALAASKDSAECLVNGKQCNWVPIGGPGGHQVGFADEAGLTSGSEGTGGVDFWLMNGEDIEFPAVCRNTCLQCPAIEDQVYTWKRQIGPVEFTRYVYYVDVDGRSALYNEIHIWNKSLETVPFTFFATVRPLSFRGVEPIVEMEYDSDSQRVIANGMVALECERAPDRVILSWNDKASLLDEIKGKDRRIDRDLRTPKGLASAVLRYDIKLQPVKDITLLFIQPLEAVTPTASRFEASPRFRDQSVENWFNFMDGSLSGTLPNEKFEKTLISAKAVLASQVIPVLRHDLCHFTDVELAALIHAVTCTGTKELVETVTREAVQLLSAADRENIVHRTPLLWAVLQAHSYYPEINILEQAESIIRRAMSFVRRKLDGRSGVKRATAVESADTAGETGEVSAPSVPSESTPSLAELIEEVWIANTVRLGSRLLSSEGGGELADDNIEMLCEASGAKFAERLRHVQNLLHDMRTASASDTIRNIIRALDTVILLGPEIFPKEFIDRLAAVLENSIREAASGQATSDVLASLPLLRFRQFHLSILRNDRDAVEDLAHGIMTQVSRYYTLSDSLCGDNKTPVILGCSIKSAIGLVFALSQMLARMEDGTLVTMRAVPEEWFTSGKEMRVWNLRTARGNVELFIGPSANQHQIEVRAENLPEEIMVYVPYERQMNTFRAYGGSIVARVESPISPYLKIIPLSSTIVVTYHR